MGILAAAMGLPLLPACAPHGPPATSGAREQPSVVDATRSNRDEAPGGLPFLRNDYAGARALALETSRPIFAEVWAKW